MLSGTYFKILTVILSVISIHIMSQTICSRMREMNWLNSSSYLIINVWGGGRCACKIEVKREVIFS